MRVRQRTPFEDHRRRAFDRGERVDDGSQLPLAHRIDRRAGVLVHEVCRGAAEPGEEILSALAQGTRGKTVDAVRAGGLEQRSASIRGRR